MEALQLRLLSSVAMPLLRQREDGQLRLPLVRAFSAVRESSEMMPRLKDMMVTRPFVGKRSGIESQAVIQRSLKLQLIVWPSALLKVVC